MYVQSTFDRSSYHKPPQAAKMPILLMPAGNDPEALLPGGELAALVEANGGRSVPFPDMLHGWASRGDLQAPDVARDHPI